MPGTEDLSRELTQAVAGGDVDAVERLLRAGADIDAMARDRLWNPLHTAIEHEQVACVQVILRHGADIEQCAGDLFTPLAHAVDIAVDGTAQTGGKPGDETTDIIHLLLQAGAEPAPGLRVAQWYGSAKLIGLLTQVINSKPSGSRPSSQAV